MKNALDQSFKQHDFPDLFSRRVLMTGLSIATALFVLFLIDIFYIQFPLVGSLVVGSLAGGSGGQISTGTIAGFWFGTILALIACLSILARDTLFAQHLASTVWLNDPFGELTCKGAKGSALIGCEVGDDVGFTANTLLLLPLLGLLLGTGGGALGRIFTHKKRTAEALWNLW